MEHESGYASLLTEHDGIKLTVVGHAFNAIMFQIDSEHASEHREKSNYFQKFYQMDIYE